MFQGQGYPKHFKGFLREPLKTLEISRVFQGYPWKPSNFKARLRVKISREVKIEARVECLKALSTFRGISRNPWNSLKLKWQIKGIVLHAYWSLAIDGKYVPRIIFMNSQGDVLEEVINKKGNPKYKYFHQTAQTVVDAMESVLQIISSKKTSQSVASTELWSTIMFCLMIRT